MWGGGDASGWNASGGVVGREAWGWGVSHKRRASGDLTLPD
jgi:hypothetical protein